MRKLCLFLLSFLLLFSLFGCQPTPDQEVIVNKDDSQLDKLIYEQAPRGIYQADQRWEESWTDSSGVSVSIQADVEVPRVDAYPAYLVQPVYLPTAQEITRQIKGMFGDLEMVERESLGWSKEQLEQKILEQKKILSEMRNGTYDFTLVLDLSQGGDTPERRMQAIQDKEAEIEEMERSLSSTPSEKDYPPFVSRDMQTDDMLMGQTKSGQEKSCKEKQK